MDPGTLVAIDAIVQLLILIISKWDSGDPTDAEKADSTQRLNASIGKLQQLVKEKFGEA
jgi:hypothetical protein